MKTINKTNSMAIIAMIAAAVILVPLTAMANTATWNSTTAPNISGWTGSGTITISGTNVQGTLNVPAGVEVTIAGTATSGGSLWFNIGVDARVIWIAQISSTTASASLIRPVNEGAGIFEVRGGSITTGGTGLIFFAQSTASATEIIISGGSVSATGNNNVFGNISTFTVTGNATINGSLGSASATINNGVTLTTDRLTVPSGRTLTNNGTITVNDGGTLTNNNGGTFTNNGTVYNLGTLANGANQTTAIFINNGTIYNSGSLTNIDVSGITHNPTQVLTFPNATEERTTDTAPFIITATNASLNGGAVTYTSSNTAVATVETSGVNAGRVTILTTGTTTITARAAPTNQWAVTTASYTLTVTAGDAPQITSANNARAVNGTAGTFQVTATGQGTITYSLTGAPTGVTINSATGLINIASTTAVGNYTFTITATGSVAPAATQSFNLIVFANGNGVIDITHHATNQLRTSDPEGWGWHINPSFPNIYVITRNVNVIGTLGTTAAPNTTTGTLIFNTNGHTVTWNATRVGTNGGTGALVEVRGNGNLTVQSGTIISTNARAIDAGAGNPTINVTGGTVGSNVNSTGIDAPLGTANISGGLVYSGVSASNFSYVVWGNNNTHTGGVVVALGGGGSTLTFAQPDNNTVNITGQTGTNRPRIDIGATATVNVSGNITVNTINNNGTLNVEATRTLTNNETITNNGVITNSGTLTNHGIINNFATLTGAVGGTSNRRVIFDLVGGARTGGGAPEQFIQSGGDVIAPVAERSGFSWGGWSTGLTNITANTTITAQWITNITTAAITVTAPVKLAIPDATATGIGNFTIGEVTWTPNPAAHFLGGTQYTASVTLTASAGHTFPVSGFSATINEQAATVNVSNAGTAQNTATLTYQFSATAAPAVTGISVKTQPTTTTFTHGETLDLSGLAVTLTHDDGTTRDVAFNYFAANNITTNPASGATLSRTTHNNMLVAVIWNNSASIRANTDDLTVNPKSVSITGVTAVNRQYDGTTVVGLQGGTLVGVIADDVVGFTLGRGTIANAEAGGNIPVTTNITLTGADAGNYTLTQPTGITVNIGTVSTAERGRIIPPTLDDMTVVAPITILAGEFTAGPNPVSKSFGSISFYWNGKTLSGGMLSVFDVNGNLVARISISDNGTNTSRREIGVWNLGNIAEGTYVVRGVLTGKDGSRERVSVVVGVR